MFADATYILKKDGLQYNKENQNWFKRILVNKKHLQYVYATTVCALLPMIIFIFVKNPVDILSVGGVVAAAHTPFIVFITWYINKNTLPKAYQAGKFTTVSFISAGLFFLAFAIYHFLNLLNIVGGGG